MAYHRHPNSDMTLYIPGDTTLCGVCGQPILCLPPGHWVHPDGSKWAHDLDYNGKVIGQHIAYPETKYPRQLQISPEL